MTPNERATMKPIHAARKAAKERFDGFLRTVKATATATVPEVVIEAAQKAYDDAGGELKIQVTGYGNPTHPVCGVSVREVI